MNKKEKIQREYFIQDCYNHYNFVYAQKIIEKEKNDVLYLFSIYQIIETMLYIFLFPKKEEEDEAELKKVEKLEHIKQKFNKKTLDKLIIKYNNKFPDDKYRLKDDLEMIRKQRNNFMHSFFIYISHCKKKDALKTARAFLKDYTKNAEHILDKKIPSMLPKE